ncbi:hypothetical protein GF314_09270, partial [bacterium]|nr:hypothetical protein [bacterium]
MRKMLVFAMMLALVGSAMAVDLGNQAPVKPEVTYPQNIPSDMRQGGDTILDAVEVTLPVVDGSGTTVGYNDDYDEVCPYTQSTSPDVVYTTTPAADVSVDIDLLGSTYDTKLYVYDEDLNLVACNDDFYPDYVSKLEQVALMGGVQYFVIIDGYGGDAGDYVINITEFEPCIIDCPAGAELEGEPPLEVGYEDFHNGGCNTEGATPFGTISSMDFCGVSGWYLAADGSNFRDTDWYEIVVPDAGFVEIFGDAEQPTYMFELGPQDCNNVAVIQQAIIGPCTENSMVIPGTPGDIVWFWVGPTTFEAPDGSDVYEYNYVLSTNLITATEN